MDSFRIVVVDDSALFRTILRNVIAEIPQCEMIASIADGKAAVEKIAELNPDLVTLDLEMPGFTGLDVLRELKRRRIKTRVLMVSRFTAAGAKATTDALIEGAFDFILKPSGFNPAENKAVLLDALMEKIAALRDAAAAVPSVPLASAATAVKLPRGGRVEAVVIGCSTGGPDALARIIPDLPADLPVPVFIVQHMPKGFTASLASRLNEASELEVLEADDGAAVKAGQVVLARGGQHLLLERLTPAGVVVRLTDAPPEHRCRPAVDYTLRSAVNVFQGRLLAVILTGMGHDGTAGCRLVASQGGQVLAQHADDCVVYGMPKSVVEAGIADFAVKLSQIAMTIQQVCVPPWREPSAVP
jgi:two-component system chemotaxis response regulator CheB